MIERLKNKVYTAVISDDTQLITRAYSDDSCSLHILSESVEPFDLAFAYSKVRRAPQPNTTYKHTTLACSCCFLESGC